jgi:hypothetical protein
MVGGQEAMKLGDCEAGQYIPENLCLVPCALGLAPVADCLTPMSDMMRLVHKQT